MFECVLVNDTLSRLGHLLSCMTILFSVFAHHQIRQAISEKHSQPGDCTWLTKSSPCVHVGMYGLTRSLLSL